MPSPWTYWFHGIPGSELVFHVLRLWGCVTTADCDCF